jgi:predicted nuclease of predicted toxin-antitoxin system
MTAKLLLNENFPIPAVLHLRKQGRDLLAIKETHPGLLDIDVMAIAVREQRWIVTFNRDYGELVFSRRLPPPPAIVLLREPRYRPSEPAEWVSEMLRVPERFVGQFVVFSRKSIRTRPLLQLV